MNSENDWNCEKRSWKRWKKNEKSKENTQQNTCLLVVNTFSSCPINCNVAFAYLNVVSNRLLVVLFALHRIIIGSMYTFYCYWFYLELHCKHIWWMRYFTNEKVWVAFNDNDSIWDEEFRLKFKANQHKNKFSNWIK